MTKQREAKQPFPTGKNAKVSKHVMKLTLLTSS